MKTKESQVARILTIVGILVLIILGTYIIEDNKKQEQIKIMLEETPLAETVYWSSMDNFPKYKIEAAEMVNELMADGRSQEEACQEALQSVSDKIYNDTVTFINENKDLSPDDWEKEYMTYIHMTQH